MPVMIDKIIIAADDRRAFSHDAPPVFDAASGRRSFVQPSGREHRPRLDRGSAHGHWDSDDPATAPPRRAGHLARPRDGAFPPKADRRARPPPRPRPAEQRWTPTRAKR